MSLLKIVIYFLLTYCSVADESVRYAPNWASLDSRPLPQWYDDAKVGIFLHWGVFSSPSYGKGKYTQSASFWLNWRRNASEVMHFMQENYPPGFTYADFAATFHAELFNPYEWARIFKGAHVKYVVLTGKHHEGFANWPSSVSWNWNSMAVGPRRDLVGKLASAIRRRTDIRFGLYHSLLEWFNPLYLEDKAAKYKTQKFVEAKTMPELYELVNTYKPDIIWSDGEWEASSKYWNSTNFLAWLYNDSPVKDTVVTNDRWGKETLCRHGGFRTCGDKYNPKVLKRHKWENCITLDRYSWGYRRMMHAMDVVDIQTLLTTLVQTISCGGNLLMNIGPTGDGRIDPIFEYRLHQFGSWMEVNEEAVYATRPWLYQNDTVCPYVWYTSKNNSVYAFILQWPTNGRLVLGAVQPSSDTSVTILGLYRPLYWEKHTHGGMTIDMPAIPYSKLPCKWVWTFKMTNVTPVSSTSEVIPEKP